MVSLGGQNNKNQLVNANFKPSLYKDNSIFVQINLMKMTTSEINRV